MNEPVLNELFRENSAAMLVIRPGDGKIIDANHSAEKFYGYSRKEFLSMKIGDINILPKKEIRKQLEGIRNKTILNPQYRHRLKDGSIRDIKVIASAVSLNHRPVNLAIILDITNELKYQDELAKFRSIAENAVAMIGVANMNREVIYINKKMRQVFGIAEGGDISNYKTVDFYSPKGKKLARSLFEKVVEKGYWQGENELQPPGAEVIPVLQTVTVVKNNEGKPLFTSMMAIDISKEKNAEKRIAESESQLKKAELISKTGSLIFNMKTGLYTLSEGAKKIYGIRKKIVTVEDITSLRTPGQSEKLNDALREITTKGKPVEVQYQIKSKTDHMLVDLLARAEYVSEMGIIITTLRDITEQKKHEKKITELNRELRTLNEYLQRVRQKERNYFAKEVHDKIGQKLVMLNIQYEQIRKLHLAETKEGDEEKYSALSKNIAEVLADFQDIYNKVKSAVLSHLSLPDAINELGNFILVKKGVEMEYHTSLGKEVYNSITRNTLLLAAEECFDNIVRHAAANHVIVSLVKKRNRLILSIRDNGSGFNCITLKKNRYGLLQVRELVNAAHGKITIVSGKGKGTTIKLDVPAI